MLKLLSHTAKNFPDVFFQGKAAAVLPIIGRILPFFSEPAFRLNSQAQAFISLSYSLSPFVLFRNFNVFISKFCSARHGVIFEAISSLLSLLRVSEREAYRQFFLDAMEVIEGARLHSRSTFLASTFEEGILPNLTSDTSLNRYFSCSFKWCRRINVSQIS